MINPRRMVCCASILFAVAGVAFAKEYYVAGEDAAASDKNPGTLEKPWKTINGNLSRIQPGDTIYVRKGIYREQMFLWREDYTFEGATYPAFPSGTSYTNMIRFIAYPGEEVVIKGSDLVTGWKKYKDHIWVHEKWPHNSQQVICDDTLLQQIGGKMIDYLHGGAFLGEKPDEKLNRWPGRKGEGLKDMTEGSFYYDLKTQSLYVWLPNNGNPNEHVMEASVRPFWFRTNVDYLHIFGFRMRYSNITPVIQWASLGIGGSHCIVENVDASCADFSALALWGSCCTVLNSTFNHNGCVGIGGKGWGHRIINCETSYNNYRGWDPYWHAGGVKIIPDGHGWIVSGHVATHNKGIGIWFDANCSAVIIQNGIVHHNDVAGIEYEISEGGVIINNIVYENRGYGILVGNSSDTLVAHNLCYRNGGPGIVVNDYKRKTGDFGRESDGLLFTRNNRVWGNILMDNGDPQYAKEDYWKNGPEMVLPEPNDRIYGNVSDYNLIFSSRPKPLFWYGWGKRVYSSLADWQKDTENDKHSRIAQPKFVNLKSRNFHPTAESPARKLARPYMSVRFDFDGNDRPATYRTAGPFEFDFPR